MFRRIITINPARCNGCGLCASTCLKVAIGIVDVSYTMPAGQKIL